MSQRSLVALVYASFEERNELEVSVMSTVIPVFMGWLLVLGLSYVRLGPEGWWRVLPAQTLVYIAAVSAYFILRGSTSRPSVKEALDTLLESGILSAEEYEKLGRRLRARRT